jgi:hypothetical protein
VIGSIAGLALARSRPFDRAWPTPEASRHAAGRRLVPFIVGGALLMVVQAAWLLGGLSVPDLSGTLPARLAGLLWPALDQHVADLTARGYAERAPVLVTAYTIGILAMSGVLIVTLWRIAPWSVYSLCEGGASVEWLRTPGAAGLISVLGVTIFGLSMIMLGLDRIAFDCIRCTWRDDRSHISDISLLRYSSLAQWVVAVGMLFIVQSLAGIYILLKSSVLEAFGNGRERL